MYQTMQHHSPEDNFHCHSCENVCRHTEPNKRMTNNVGPTFKTQGPDWLCGSSSSYKMSTCSTVYRVHSCPATHLLLVSRWSRCAATSTLPCAFTLQCLMKCRNNFILCCFIPDASRAFKENYFYRIAMWTRMFRNTDTMHVLVNKLNPHHKQKINKEEIYQAIGRERINFQSFYYPNTITNNKGVSFY